MPPSCSSSYPDCRSSTRFQVGKPPILPASPILDWTLPQPIVYGTPLGGAQLNATASVPGTFTYSPAAGTVLDAGASHLLTATFTSADPNYSSDGVITSFWDSLRDSFCSSAMKLFDPDRGYSLKSSPR